MDKRIPTALPSEAHERFMAEYALRARHLLDHAEERFRRRRYPDVVAAAQEALELIAKSLFHWLGLTPPKSHRLVLAEFSQSLRGLMDEVAVATGPLAREKLQLPRLIFLADFWAAAHTLARYGSEPIAATPSELFTRAEATLALTHLREAVRHLEDAGEAMQVEFLDDIKHRLQAMKAGRDAQA
jgi:HEPN domain-containing protein